MVPPKHTVKIMFSRYFSTGGNTTNPAVANAPSTKTTELARRMEVCKSALRTFATASLMNPCLVGKTPPAPDRTVAIARKKERLLKIQNT